MRASIDTVGVVCTSTIGNGVPFCALNSLVDFSAAGVTSIGQTCATTTIELYESSMLVARRCEILTVSFCDRAFIDLVAVREGEGGG